jgi:hypothetical protein
MIRPTATESIPTLMDPSTKANGLMINNMELEESHGKMVAITMVTTSTPRKKEEECIAGQMETNMLVTGLIMLFMDMVFTCGEMAEFIAESGKTI